MGKPIRKATQQTWENTCSYVATVNLLQGIQGRRKKLGTLKAFTAGFKRRHKAKILSEQTRTRIMKRILREFPRKQVHDEFKKQLKAIWKAEWSEVYGVAGLSQGAAQEALQFHFGWNVSGNPKYDTKEYYAIKHGLVAILATMGESVFNHSIAIRNGYVIDSCILEDDMGNTTNHDGVYKWTGEILGYDTWTFKQAVTYDNVDT